jgi:hypothetical protein
MSGSLGQAQSRAIDAGAGDLVAEQVAAQERQFGRDRLRPGTPAEFLRGDTSRIVSVTFRTLGCRLCNHYRISRGFGGLPSGAHYIATPDDVLTGRSGRGRIL